MSQAVSIQLSAPEQEALFRLVEASLAQGVAGKGMPSPADVPEPSFPALLEPRGAFVTLHIHGRLRGCIGMMEATAPLYLTVASMAWAAAFNDSRFSPLTEKELPYVSFDISILGPMAPCPDPSLIELGRHGLMLSLGNRRGVFLPQVPVEQGWDLPTTLEHLCQKAGLPARAWQDKEAKLFWYESLQIAPEKPIQP